MDTLHTLLHTSNIPPLNENSINRYNILNLSNDTCIIAAYYDYNILVPVSTPINKLIRGQYVYKIIPRDIETVAAAKIRKIFLGKYVRQTIGAGQCSYYPDTPIYVEFGTLYDMTTNEFLIALSYKESEHGVKDYCLIVSPKVYDSKYKKYLSLLNAFKKLKNTENLPIIIMKYDGLDAKFNFKISKSMLYNLSLTNYFSDIKTVLKISTEDIDNLVVDIKNIYTNMAEAFRP